LLLKKDLLHNSEYLFGSFTETAELADKLDKSSAEDVSTLSSFAKRSNDNTTDNNKKQLPQLRRHISINHFASMDKKYEVVKLPKIARLPTIVSCSKSGKSSSYKSRRAANLDMAAVKRTQQQTVEIAKQDTISIADSDFEPGFSNRNNNNNYEASANLNIFTSGGENENNDDYQEVSDFDAVNYLDLGMKLMSGDTNKVAVTGIKVNKKKKPTRSRKSKMNVKISKTRTEVNEDDEVDNDDIDEEEGEDSEESDDLAKSQVYMASIGDVPNLYHERRVKPFHKRPTVRRFYPPSKHHKPGRSYVSRKKSLAAVVCNKIKQSTVTKMTTSDGKKSSLNLDKTKMSLKDKYRIDMEVQGAFKYTNLMSNRHYELSTNTIRLNFTSLQLKNGKSSVGVVPVADYKDNSTRQLIEIGDNLVLPSIALNKFHK
jgi:hypothetical protein